ncbi:MAG: alpha/beta fold hydrolase [Deltaproteobacteria bacterium]|nr:alpha/beta fold hydrolase [Deltaproteobacteria bacterium]
MSEQHAWFWLDEGQGYPLVLLHGLGASTFSWRCQREPLGRHFRLLAPDLPGHGRTLVSPGGDFSIRALAAGVARCLQDRGVTQAAVAGNSLGGGLALWLAREHPEMVSHLILLAPAAALRRLPYIFVPLSLPVLGNLTALALGPWILPPALGLIFHNRDLITPEVLEGYAPPYRDRRQRRLLGEVCRQLQLLPLEEVAALLRKISCPTVLIWGVEDRILPLGQGCWMLAHLTQARPYFLPGVGHAPQEEAPDRVNQIIIDFLRGTLKN